jgi:hypothetical protein
MFKSPFILISFLSCFSCSALAESIPSAQVKIPDASTYKVIPGESVILSSSQKLDDDSLVNIEVYHADIVRFKLDDGLECVSITRGTSGGGIDCNWQALNAK